MTIQLISPKSSITPDQRFVLPGYYSWQQFEAIAALTSDAPNLRLTYLDGMIEFMTLGEDHEETKKRIAILLEAYLFVIGMEFIPVGSATRRAEEKKASFEPDESYYLGTRKVNPDLAIEVIITSGSLDKLEKYKRFGITEVWFWQDQQLSVYRLVNGNYQQVYKSELLPDLDLNILGRCLKMPSILDARKEFLKVITKT